MNLLAWLLREHPLIREAKRIIQRTAPSLSCSLDELVVRSRLPVRTVLLAANALDQSQPVDRPPQDLSPLVTTGAPKSALPTEVVTAYANHCSHREEPVLLWGQRRLTLDSAIERACYVLQWLPRKRGRIVFLGDDDAVSPLVAAAAPAYEVEVLDIDRGVLVHVDNAARAIGATLTTINADVSHARNELRRGAEMVICDPCPTSDGSFEAMFWSEASALLQPRGLLVTTFAPSHKPLAFSFGALSQLSRTGFSLRDSRPDFGKYEVFPFEFLPAERTLLQRFHWTSQISQTKSLCAAEKTSDSATATPFDFQQWMNEIGGHYLTTQAGIMDQHALLAQRGAGPIASPLPRPLCRGLRVDAILPVPRRLHRQSSAIALSVDPAMHTLSELSRLGVHPKPEEVAEIHRLSKSSAIVPSGPLAWLGLAVRAIESWERCQYQ